MKIIQIEIKSSNNDEITDVGPLLDNLDFIKDILEIRKKWKINKFYDPSAFPVFIEYEIMTNKDSLIDNDEVQKRLEIFNQDVSDIRKKYNKTRNFDIVIKYVIACNCVPEGIYRKCYFDRILVNSQDNSNDDKNYQYVIYVNPRTQKKDVEEAFRDFEAFIKGKIEFHRRTPSIPGDEEEIEEFRQGVIQEMSDPHKCRTIKFVSRTRTLYWYRYENVVNGASTKLKTFPEIIEMWNKRCPYYNDEDNSPDSHSCEYCSLDDESNIQHSVNDYEKLVKMQ